MCRNYTKFFPKIAPSGKGENPPENIQVIRTILLKISNLEANLVTFKRIVGVTCIFSFFVSPFPDGAILENKKCIVSTHTKLHVQAKNLPFWIFIGYMMYGFLSQALLTKKMIWNILLCGIRVTRQFVRTTLVVFSSCNHITKSYCWNGCKQIPKTAFIRHTRLYLVNNSSWY